MRQEHRIPEQPETNRVLAGEDAPVHAPEKEVLALDAEELSGVTFSPVPLEPYVVTIAPGRCQLNYPNLDDGKHPEYCSLNCRGVGGNFVLLELPVRNQQEIREAVNASRKQIVAAVNATTYLAKGSQVTDVKFV